MGESEASEMSCGHFQKKYNKAQRVILQIGYGDEQLSGMSCPIMRRASGTQLVYYQNLSIRLA